MTIKRRTVQDYIKDGQKYNSRSEWKRKSPKMYHTAVKRKILDICCSHMEYILFYWDLEKCKEDALKYSARGEWAIESNGAYSAALKNNWIKECCSHMKVLHTIRSKDFCIKDASSFTTKNEWRMKSPACYAYTTKHGWIEECCSHMPKSSIDSMPEKELFLFIKEEHKTAKKQRFGKIIQGQYGTLFELDIYIPELNKGIEFNGKYWHSFKGLKKSRPHWSDEDLRNYHSIKREFFNKLHIDYIEIEENDWDKDSNKCINKCLSFLNNNNISMKSGV